MSSFSDTYDFLQHGVHHLQLRQLSPDDGVRCSICLEDYTDPYSGVAPVRIDICGHTFCLTCLRKQAETGVGNCNKCAICRQELFYHINMEQLIAENPALQDAVDALQESLVAHPDLAEISNAFEEEVGVNGDWVSALGIAARQLAELRRAVDNAIRANVYLASMLGLNMARAQRLDARSVLQEELRGGLDEDENEDEDERSEEETV